METSESLSNNGIPNARRWWWFESRRVYHSLPIKSTPMICTENAHSGANLRWANEKK
jgi:hypothetical protein